jgi:hypothetical protein
MATSWDHQAAGIICIKEGCSGGNSRAQDALTMSRRGWYVKVELTSTSSGQPASVYLSATALCALLYKHICKASH